MGFITNKCQCICLALIIVLGAWAYNEASARTLQGQDDASISMYDRYQNWMAHHGRVYEDVNEKEKRFEIFKRNEPYKLGVNQLADLTNEEFRASRNRYKAHVCGSSKTTWFRYENVSVVPSSLDWRKKGAVTPVKDQGQCAVAAVEGITKLSTGKLVSLSEQELVDCDVKGEDQGCNGGLMDDAFKFIQTNRGLNTESGYPYTGVDGTCNAKEETKRAAKITGHEDVPANSENNLLKAVSKQPVSVAIDAGGFEFQFYSSGVFTGACGTSLDHGVTAVGYGVDEDGTKYCSEL
ncbi:Peptidase C1A [Trema orientale]|uniref:Peptidase C1A n=1 Tax=Trema orientale TaxID=63057 RepID=A0A2P5FF53_TREOI|nr:Peptidase C1A [Trema orientale]